MVIFEAARPYRRTLSSANFGKRYRSGHSWHAACWFRLQLGLRGRECPGSAQGRRLNMARTATILCGIVGGLYWGGFIEIEGEHLKWFCVPLTAYLVGMVILFE
jgi:hypothetical protein